MRARPLLWLVPVAVVACLIGYAIAHLERRSEESRSASQISPDQGSGSGSGSPKTIAGSTGSQIAAATPDSAPTEIYAHNLLLRKGPNFRVYVRYLHGRITRSKRNVVPSFDDPDSFFLDVKTGVLRANIGDIGNFLNASGSNAPFQNLHLSGNEDQVKITGTVHKIVSLPVELDGTIAALPGNQIRMHVTKLDVLKVPLKGLLGVFHVKVADLFHSGAIPGIVVDGNDITFDTQTLLPPPHIRGQLTKVHVVNPDLEEVYGDAKNDVTRTEQWRNYLRLRDGSLDFGKLTMHHVDLIMIDISKDAWFDLDLANYQAQLVNGYTRMTPEAGLQIFMPDLRDLPPTPVNKNISLEWLKNRNLAPPPEITAKSAASK